MGGSPRNQNSQNESQARGRRGGSRRGRPKKRSSREPNCNRRTTRCARHAPNPRLTAAGTPHKAAAADSADGRRRQDRPDDLDHHRPAPVDRAQHSRARERLNGRRLRSRRSDPQPGRPGSERRFGRSFGPVVACNDSAERLRRLRALVARLDERDEDADNALPADQREIAPRRGLSATSRGTVGAADEPAKAGRRRARRRITRRRAVGRGLGVGSLPPWFA